MDLDVNFLTVAPRGSMHSLEIDKSTPISGRGRRKGVLVMNPRKKLRRNVMFLETICADCAGVTCSQIFVIGARYS